MRICSNFFVTLRWYCSYLEDRKKKFHPRDGHGGPDTPMFKKIKKSKEEKHYMSSRCSCGVIKVSTARCDIPLRLEAATLATCFLDHNAASAPPRRRKHSTFSPPFLARVWNRSPLKVRRHVVCFSCLGFFLERMRHSFLPRNSNLDVAKSVDTVSKLAQGTLTSFFIHPFVLLGQDDELEWHRIS